jgi:hypothetical protein
MDEYVRQNIIQNNGGLCEYCGSAIGHYNVCGLLNRSTGEAHRASQWTDATQRHLAARSAVLFSENVNNGFYRRTRTPELLLTPEDEQFLREINKAFKQ